jgi:hypothetical protein
MLDCAMLARRALAVLPLLLACDAVRAPPPVAPPAPSAAAVEAEPSAAPPTEAAAPAPAPPPPPLTATAIVREAAALQPGDATSPLAPEGETAIDPLATFRVALSEPSRDARLVLLDAADAAVPAQASTEVGTTTVLTLAPSSPLAPGAHYRLRLDGAVTRELHAGETAYLPAAWGLKATGDPTPAARPVHRTRPHRK